VSLKTLYNRLAEYAADAADTALAANNDTALAANAAPAADMAPHPTAFSEEQRA
jgi:hypothetical protein